MKKILVGILIGIMAVPLTMFAQGTWADKGEWTYSVTGDSSIKVSPSAKGLGPLDRGTTYRHMLHLRNDHPTDALTVQFSNQYDNQYVDVYMFNESGDVQWRWGVPPLTTIMIAVEIAVKWDAPFGTDTIYWQPTHIIDLTTSIP